MAKLRYIMKKAVKISFSIIGTFVVLIIIGLLTLDMSVLYMLRKQLEKVNSEEMEVSIDGLHLSPLVGSASIYGVSFRQGEKNHIGYTEMHLPRVHVNNINVFRAIREKHLELRNVKVNNLYVDALLPHPEGQMELRASDIDVVVRGISYVDTIRVDSVEVDGRDFFFHLSKFHAPAKPYGMPQDGLSKIPMPLRIGRLGANLRQFDFALTTQDVPYAQLTMTDIKAMSRNITTEPNSTILVNAEAHLGHGGCAWLAFSMKQNKACNTGLELLVVDAKGAALDGLLRPLVGMTIDCNIDTIKSSLHGDKHDMNGTFMMRYHDLWVTAHKGESPYEIVNKNSGAINTIANTLLPKANPNPLTPENVRKYNVHSTRNVMQPYPLFPVMAIVDGLKDTMLPGLFVEKRVRENKHVVTTPVKTDKPAKAHREKAALSSHHSHE